jgi:hypothetical protein
MSKVFAIAIAFGVAILTVVFPFDRACAQNQKRIALVVGNSNYAHVPKLPNPSRDAISVGQMFRDAGFNNVDVLVNATNIEFKRAIRKFEIDADQADIAVIFYAGHGIEIGGANYLIPIDARLASDRDAEDEAVTLDRVVASADGASKLRLIMLDACRDNPFTSLMRRDRKNREVSAGLGRAQPTSTDTLIAYAAKAGSTAEDGEGQHSPFTSAILKHLTNPGLDVRLAFGRVRDEVMRATGSRQEPYVYGALGGSNISLVPAPKVQDTPIADVKADYELVAKIGTRRAWEVFLGTHKTGFYADLARVQIAALSEQQQAGSSVTRSKPGDTNMLLAGVPSASPPGGRESSSQESLDWNKIKDSTDPAAFEKFIQKYPDAPLAVAAKTRLDVLKKAAAEREAARKAAEKAAEEARLEAERKKAEIAAAKKREEEERLAAKRREEEERRAKAAEAEQKAKAAEAERQVVKQREEAERRAKAAETEQKAKAAEAERKAAEARQRAEEAERSKAAAQSAAARAETERLAQQADAERRKAEQASALETACKTEQSKFEDLSAKGSDGAGVQNLAAFAKSVTCDRLRPQVTATLNRFYTEAACKAEQAKFEDLKAKGSDGAGVQNMADFAKTVTCDVIRPQVATAIERFSAEAAKRAATAPNAPQLVLAAQTELARLGCTLPGKPDGILNAATKTALGRFASLKGRATDNTTVTEALVSELTKQTDRVCPLECKAGELAKGDKCVAQEKPAAPAAPAATSRKKDDDEDEPVRRKPRPEKRQVEKEQRRAPAPAPEPRARVQAIARPSGGGGGGHGAMIGVGF